MKQTYEVMWAEIAQTDLRRIVSYIVEDSMSRAFTNSPKNYQICFKAASDSHARPDYP